MLMHGRRIKPGVTMVEKQGFVYLLASQKQGTIYTGVTSDLVRRTSEHRSGIKSGFPSRHGVLRLVYYEIFESIIDAIEREKTLKNWKRTWKAELIETSNPDWNDLYQDIIK